MRRNILLVALLLSQISGFALSNNSRISVLTSDPGIEYYTIFGHSAIRVTDDSLGIDRVYNFGTFDFSEPYFYMKFIKGNLKYFLSISDFKTFMSYSYLEKRKIHEQVLDLNLIERSKIFNNLESCYNSPDRYYIYDFYYDNCATRVRDFIFKSTEQQISFDSNQYKNKTFRQLLKPYIAGNYWIDFGINLVLGRESDKIARPDDYMFLPFYIMSILQTTSIVKEQKIILDASESIGNSYNYSYLSPWIIVVILLLLSVWSKSRKIVFYTVTSVVGFSGLVLLAIGFYTDNEAFSNNLNVLWTIPSILVILFSGKRTNRLIKVCYILLLLLLLLFRNYLPQELSSTIIPWIMCLILILLLDFNDWRSTLHKNYHTFVSY